MSGLAAERDQHGQNESFDGGCQPRGSCASPRDAIIERADKRGASLEDDGHSGTLR